MTKQKELQKLLKELLNSVFSICTEGQARNRFKSEGRLYLHHWTRNSKYDTEGTIIENWEESKHSDKVWHEATITIEQEIKKLSIYNEASTKIGSIYGMEEKSCDYYLSRLIDVVAWRILESEITDKASLEPYILLFLRELNHEEQLYKVVAQVKGIVLEPESIQLDGNTLLRKPVQEDTPRFDSETLYSRRYPFNIPTTIVELTRTSPPNLVGVRDVLEINTLIAILSLFRVGGVEFITYNTRIDSVFTSTGISTKRIHLLKSGDYLVENGDVETLKKFWANMKKVELPISIPGEQKEPNELSIAYERYSDSLEGGIIEKRISSAVMGLEALYLSPSEQQEMSYRLRMRVSKLLSIIGYNPKEVQERMKDAYNEIRSKYVHGGTLKQKDRQKLEEKYGKINEFSRIIMDYLRASIVVLLKRPSKTSLIQKIDDSFLDGRKEEEVRELLFIPY